MWINEKFINVEGKIMVTTKKLNKKLYFLIFFSVSFQKLHKKYVGYFLFYLFFVTIFNRNFIYLSIRIRIYKIINQVLLFRYYNHKWYSCQKPEHINKTGLCNNTKNIYSERNIITLLKLKIISIHSTLIARRVETSEK